MELARKISGPLLVVLPLERKLKLLQDPRTEGRIFRFNNISLFNSEELLLWLRKPKSVIR